uniref:Putative secreted protein n=1 Tax=Xenopsylla cheopis TaxID=163159 RepID=A0A6M2DYW6_XENCH
MVAVQAIIISKWVAVIIIHRLIIAVREDGAAVEDSIIIEVMADVGVETFMEGCPMTQSSEDTAVAINAYLLHHAVTIRLL